MLNYILVFNKSAGIKLATCIGEWTPSHTGSAIIDGERWWMIEDLICDLTRSAVALPSNRL